MTLLKFLITAILFIIAGCGNSGSTDSVIDIYSDPITEINQDEVQNFNIVANNDNGFSSFRNST